MGKPLYEFLTFLEICIYFEFACSVLMKGEGCIPLVGQTWLLYVAVVVRWQLGKNGREDWEDIEGKFDKVKRGR